MSKIIPAKAQKTLKKNSRGMLAALKKKREEKMRLEMERQKEQNRSMQKPSIKKVMPYRNALHDRL